MRDATFQQALHDIEVSFLQARIIGHEDSLMKLFSRIENLLVQHPDASPLRDDLERFIRSERSIYISK